jgi:hypothetical protein
VRIWLPYHIRRSAGLAARVSTAAPGNDPALATSITGSGIASLSTQALGASITLGQFAGAACLVSFPIGLAPQQMQ